METINLITTSELAELLNTSANSIRVMRARGKSPPYLKISKEVLYDVEDVKKWLNDNKIRKGKKNE